MRCPRAFLVLVASLWFGSGSLRAAVPVVLTHHGFLTDSSGGSPSPVTGPHQLTFSLYDGASAGLAVWAEDVTVTVSAGYYQARLGLSSPIDVAVVAALSEPLLGIAVDGGEELSPRLPVTAVPFALAAGLSERASDLECDGCVAADEVAFAYAGSSGPGGAASDVACSDCVSTTELMNGAVTNAKILSGAVDTSSLADGAVTPAKLHVCPADQVLVYGASGWLCSGTSLVVTAGGNVGIGAATPSTKLQVAGLAQANGWRATQAAAATPPDLDTLWRNNLPKAWVNFTGVSGASIQAAYNVSGVTRNAAGDYTITFATAMPDANYVAVLTAQRNNVNSDFRAVPFTTTPATTTTFRLQTGPSSVVSNEDAAVVHAVFFGN